MTANKPLRILRIIARLNVGGPARHVILLTEKFRERGWTSELIVGEVDASEGSMEDFATARGIVPLKFEKLGREISFLNDLPIIWKLFRFMVSFGPDIVHTHTAKAGAVGRIAALLYHRLHWRGLWAPRPVHVYHTFHGHVLSGYFSPLKSRIFRLLERGLAYFSTNLITLSESLRDELAGFGVTRSEKMTVVSLGIELDAFLKTKEFVPGEDAIKKTLSLPGDVPLVGIVGRLVPIKDHICFFESAARLIKAEAGQRAGLAHFLIVGDGELRPDLEQKARALGIHERCHFLGWRSDLPEIYESLDLIALTSRNEGTPLCVIEGMAASRAIVATQVGGVGDLTGIPQDGNYSGLPAKGEFHLGAVGALARPEDVEGFASAMGFLLNNPEKLTAMGRAGRERVHRYSIDRLVNNLESLYLSNSQ